MPVPAIAPSVLPKYLREGETLATVRLAAEKTIALPGRVELRPVVRAWNRFGGLLERLCSLLAVEPACAVAVICVESGGSGFGSDGRLKIRLEVHLFKRLLETKGAATERFAEHFRFDAHRPWQDHEFRAHFGEAWQRVHASQSSEWTALEFARQWDEDAALCATSFGAPQVLGRNFAALRYASARAMLDAFADREEGDRNQILGLFDFLRNAWADGRVLEHLRQRDYLGFARLYNGPGQAVLYGERIERFAAAFESL